MSSKLFLLAIIILLCGLTASIQAIKTVRINAGATTSYVDTNGNTWAPDAPYQNGYGTVTYTGGNILGTNDGVLFYSDRTANNRRHPLTYTFTNMDNSEYSCNLYFAEQSTAAFSTSRRVFHVYINGERVATSFDIYKQVGPTKALIQSYDCSPVNGKIEISFGFFIGKPKICAIEIVVKDAPSPSPVPPTPSASPSPAPPSTIPDTLPGIATYYYDYNTTNEMLDHMPIPFNRKPVIGVIENTPFYKPEDYTLFRNSPWSNQFAVTFNFYLDITNAGLYVFRTLSNDGTILYCSNNQLIFSNDGNHDMINAVTGQINFDQGLHKCILYFYQSIHRSGFDVKWKPPGGADFVEIPVSSMSFAPKEAAPVIHSITPASGNAGTTVSITGFGFYYPAANTQVLFGTVAASSVTVVDSEHLTVVVPAGVPSGQLNVVVKTPVDTSNPVRYSA